jgi:hypothetical protein
MTTELNLASWRLSAHTKTNGEKSKAIDGQNRDTHPNCTNELPGHTIRLAAFGAATEVTLHFFAVV